MSIRGINLSKSFGQNVILSNINFELLEGKRYGIMGASGIGKTTLIHILMGLEKQDSGQIEGLDGKKLAAVFQEDRLIEHYDAIKNIKLVCDSSLSDEKIQKELKKVSLEENLHKPVSKMSGGMRRRVAIVRAILALSDIVIMDEPLKGLDAKLKDQVLRYIDESTKSKTLLIVTHELEDIRKLEAELLCLS